MLSEIFKALLITSLTGSCLAAVITLAKPITKKVFGCSWHYYIWLAVLAVMVLPVRFTLPQKTAIPPVTAMQTVQTEQTEQPMQTTAAEDADNAVPSAQEKPDIMKSGTAFVQKIIDNRLNILALLWLIGATVLLLINLIGYIRLIIKMRKNSAAVSCPELMNFTDKKVTVRIWENTSSPFMTGIFRPTLVLPARKLSKEQLNNILRHEMTHFKRHDILYKWFVSFVKCLHWFNPVIWYVAKQINAECEISCDMKVTLAMNKDEEMSYINTVLSLLPVGKSKQIPLTTQMASSKKILKRRFTMIKNKKKTSKFVSALSAVTAVVMFVTTVFASGVLSDISADDYTVEILNNGEKIELANKPFIENGEVYVPLRETLKLADSQAEIMWDNDSISIKNRRAIYKIRINDYFMNIERSGSEPHTFTQETYHNCVPLLKNSVTYMTIQDINYIAYNWMSVSYAILDYTIADKDGKTVAFNSHSIKFSGESGEYFIKIPNSWARKYVIQQSGDNVKIMHTAIYDKYGEGSSMLFSIEKVSKESADELLNISEGSRLLYSNDEYAYIFQVPADVQHPVWIDRDEESIELAAEYERMFADVYSVADSFTLTEVQ